MKVTAGTLPSANSNFMRKMQTAEKCLLVLQKKGNKDSVINHMVIPNTRKLH